jgi:hypothetical protein
MDAWWEADGKVEQRLTFIGEHLRALGVDDHQRQRFSPRQLDH